MRFHVELLEVYDSTSISLYDESFLPDGPWARTSCFGADGLHAGSAFEFTTDRYSPGYTRGRCSYREMVSVEGVGVGAGRYAWAVAGEEQETFAGWTRTARLAGEKVPYELLVVAPTGAPFDPVVTGEAPPALVVRYMNECRDAWVAFVEMAP